MTTSSTSINRSLGQLEGQIKSLLTTFKFHVDMEEKQQLKLQERLDKLENTIVGIAASQSELRKDFVALEGKMHEILDKSKAQENQRLGAKSLLIAIGALIMWVFAVAEKYFTIWTNSQH